MAALRPTSIVGTGTPTKEEAMRTKRVRIWIATVAAALGIAVGAAGISNAASSQAPTQSTTAAAPTAAAQPPAGNPATMSHGPGETLLTGTAASKVTAAAKAAVPGGTIIRVETDSG